MSPISTNVAATKPGIDNEEYVYVTVESLGQVVTGPPPFSDNGIRGKPTSLDQTPHFCAMDELCTGYCNLGAYVPGLNDRSNQQAEIDKLLLYISLKFPQ